MPSSSQFSAVDSTIDSSRNGLQISGLQKMIGARHVLNDIDLSVPSGQLLTILGPSGSGKTTLLRLLCGFERADAGSIRLADRMLAADGRRHVPPERRGIGYVAQEGALFPHLDVRRNIEFGLTRQQRATTDITQLLADVGLPADYAERAPSALSGGEQQRVALARALAPRPGLVLLDEPFSSLDAGLRAETRAAVAATLKATGTTAIVVTHDQAEALSMGDMIAVLQHGRFAQVGPPHEVYRHPINRQVASFVGEAVRVVGEGDGDRVHCCFGCLPLAPTNEPCHGCVEVLIRPEQFRLQDSADAGSSHDTNAQAQVEGIDFYGHDARVDLKTTDDVVFRAVAPGFDIPAVGDHVFYEIAGRVHAYPTE